MYGAELKAWRESVGLSASGLGHLLGVKTRTISYWEGWDHTTFPGDVLADIRLVQNHLESRLKILRGDFSGEFLVVYRDLEDIRMLDPVSYRAGVTPQSYLRLAYEAHRHAGGRIRYLEVGEYLRWLLGRPDTPANRAEWAKDFTPLFSRNTPS